MIEVLNKINLNWKRQIISNLSAVISLGAVSLLWENQLSVLIILIVISFVLLLERRSKSDLVIYIFTGISGALAEAIAVYFGAWEYSNPSMLGIPYWLPVLWGVAGIYLINCHEAWQKLKYQIKDSG